MKKIVLLPPEKWQSGLMRQSWKLLTVIGPGVRIPLSPRINTKGFKRQLEPFLFYANPSKAIAFVRGCIKQEIRRVAAYFCILTPGPTGISAANPCAPTPEARRYLINPSESAQLNPPFPQWSLKKYPYPRSQRSWIRHNHEARNSHLSLDISKYNSPPESAQLNPPIPKWFPINPRRYNHN